MKTSVTLFLLSLAASMAGPAAADRDGVCPVGPGVCYTPDCQAIAGQCDPKKRVDPTADFIGYINGVDGSYTVSATCSNGKDLSNVIVSGSNGTKKYEAGIDELPQVQISHVDGNREWDGAVIKKCGDECLWYGDRGHIQCNPTYH